MDFVVCDGSRIQSTGIGAAVVLCSWGPTAIHRTPDQTPIERVEALGLSIALTHALEYLQHSIAGIDGSVTIYTDQQIFDTHRNATDAAWKKTMAAARSRNLDLPTQLAQARTLIVTGRLQIQWMQSHQPRNTSAGRLMRHADALAFLVAYGALDAQGPLPTYPNPHWITPALRQRSDPVLPHKTGAIPGTLSSMNMASLSNKQLLRTTLTRGVAPVGDTDPVVMGKPHDLIILADVRKRPFALVDSMGRRARLDPRGTSQAVLNKTLSAAIAANTDTDTAAVSPSGHVRVRVVLLGDFPSLATHLLETPTFRAELIDMGQPHTRIIVGNLSRKQIRANPSLNPLHEMVLRAKAASAQREKNNSCN